jgi:hypothetical protein
VTEADAADGADVVAEEDAAKDTDERGNVGAFCLR